MVCPIGKVTGRPAKVPWTAFPAMRAASALDTAAPSGAPAMSAPYKGTAPMPGSTNCASMSGAKWTSKGRAESAAM